MKYSICMIYYVAIIIITGGCFYKIEHKASNELKAGKGIDLSDTVVGNKSITGKKNVVLTFMDSVFHRYELSHAQIRNHLMLDSFYYAQDASFKGDTIYLTNEPYFIAVINYNDGLNCAYKLLCPILKGAGKSFDFEIVQADCDADESSSYNNLTFNMISDTSFMTVETFYPKGLTDTTGSATTKQVWRITNEGRIQMEK